MGEAWVARDAERGEEVVAKILPPDAPEERVALLRREARLVRKLKHPGIVPVHGFERGPHGSAVLLRYMKGGDAGRLKGAPPLEVVRLGREVAEALGHLHGLGVVHRDVKPTNVLLDEAGRAHLADFGIAAVAAPDDNGLVLHGGGSRATMSPQQRAGEPAAPADDVYALGALLYELLSKRPPFPPEATDDEVRTAAPPPLESPHALPFRLRSLVASMLAKEPGARPRDMGVAEEELSAIEGEIVGASSPKAREADNHLEPPPRVRDVAPVTPPDRPDVRLQPPPRVPEVGVAPAVPPARPSSPPPRDKPRARSLRQAMLLGALALAAVFVVFVLPRWTQTRPPSSAPAAQDTAVPADASEPAVPPDALPEAPPPLPEATPRTSEAPPSPPEPTPPPSAPRVEPTPSRPRSPGKATPDPAAADAARRAEEFRTAMSEAQAAHSRSDWPVARKALARASALEPGSPAVADARRRIEEGERAAALAHQREVARAAEMKEDWRRAVAEYEAALRLDPAVAFALEGRRRASSREVLLQQAREIEAPGPRHRRQIADLERALQQARTSVAVVLESDEKTEVVVHKVGRLGTFERKVLELRPGTYTVVGKRRGYRDVRRQLVVEPEGSPPPLVVRCEEEI
jgi:serine/threonine protein kinase